MNRKEITQIITLLAGNYSEISNKTEQQKQMILTTWYECLGDLDYNLVLQAVKKTIISSPYPPTIHEIRKSAIELANTQKELTSIEAWNEAYKMICNGTYMTEEEFNNHSPLVKLFFGNVNQLRAYSTNEDCNIDVVRSNFLKQYDILQQREKDNKMLPKNIKDFMIKLQKNSIKQIGDTNNETNR